MADQITYRIGALFQAKGNLGAKVAASARQVSDIGSKLSEAGRSARAFGSDMLNSATAAAGAYARMGAMLTGGALAVGAAALAKVGFTGNVGLEQMQNTIAGTLQLFNHSAGAANQLAQNVKVAGAALMKVQDIADKAPGELKDIQNLFTNMLPGARAATGDMKRILDLTKNVALFTPTFGVDFATSGSQIGRILSGGAGAEMQPWLKLNDLIMKAGLNMDKMAGGGKIFAKSLDGAAPEKITAAFNKLQKEDRFALIEKVLSKGGDDLANMYASSWEGATAAAVSGGRKVAMAMTSPIFGEIKKALVRAGKEDNSLLGKNKIGQLQGQAAAIGMLMARPVVKILDGLERGIRYFQDNFNAVFNRMYQAFQVGGALIRAAFAYGVGKMILGAGIMAASSAIGAGRRVVGGVSTGYRATKSGIGGVRKVARGLGDAFDSLSKGSAVSRTLSLFTMMGTVLSGIAASAVVVIPMLVIAGLALGALSVVLLAVGGVAAYIASKWTELSASVVKGFEDGSITLRPLVIAALILWERLKKVGETFIGATTGAGMMQWAINMATSVINGLAEGVSLLAEVASAFLKTIAYGTKGARGLWGIAKETGKAATTVATGGLAGLYMYGGERQSSGMLGTAVAKARGEDTRDWTDKAIGLGNKLETAANSWRAVDMKNLDPGEIEDWTKKANDMAKDLFGGDSTDPKKKPKGTYIHQVIANIDLRNTDPDRMMVGLMEPIRKATMMPSGSEYDREGF